MKLSFKKYKWDSEILKSKSKKINNINTVAAMVLCAVLVISGLSGDMYNEILKNIMVILFVIISFLLGMEYGLQYADKIIKNKK